MAKATLVLSSPEEDATILGNRVTVDFTVGEIVLVDPSRVSQNKSGTGHLHLWLDAPNATKETAIHYFLPDAFTFDRVPSGNHALVVEVVNNDHTPFDPPVRQMISFQTKQREEIALQAIVTPTPTHPLSSPNIIRQTILPLFTALILINIGLVWWLWSKQNVKT